VSQLSNGCLRPNPLWRPSEVTRPSTHQKAFKKKVFPKASEEAAERESIEALKRGVHVRRTNRHKSPIARIEGKRRMFRAGLRNVAILA